MPPTEGVEVLDREQCLDLLGTVRVGRLAFTEHDLPTVQPVNFRLHEGQVVIRVAGGTKLAAAAANAVVAFQADELDADLRAGWTVTVVGRAGLVNEVDDLVVMAGIWLQPWGAGPSGPLRAHPDRTGDRTPPASPSRPRARHVVIEPHCATTEFGDDRLRVEVISRTRPTNR